MFRSTTPPQQRDNTELSNKAQTVKQSKMSKVRSWFRNRKINSNRNSAPKISTEAKLETPKIEVSDAELTDMIQESNNPELLSGRGEYECSSIRHPNVIRYENVTLDLVNNEACLIVLMDVYSCTLWQYLKHFHRQNRNIPMRVRFKLFKKIFSGSKEIQDHGFKHLDLKPGNVLLITRPDGTWNEVDCVLTDFGIGALHDQETGKGFTRFLEKGKILYNIFKLILGNPCFNPKQD